MISVDLKVVYNQTYSYALTGTTRRIVRAITVTNTGAEDTAGTPVSVQVSVAAPLEQGVLATWEGPEQQLPRPAGQGAPVIEWSNVNLRLSPAVLGRLSEQVQADLIVRVMYGGEVIAEQGLKLVLLAAADWVFDEANLDLLAAFVLPNARALRPVMTKARDLLDASTRSSRTQGYQAGPQRVNEIAEAIYDAIRSLGLSYSDPPGAFENHAQKIRSPEAILDEKAMTCLDSTVFYASCLAQAGLHPLLFLVRGHAFAGYLTSDRTNLPPALTDKQKIAEGLTNGDYRAVETTTMTANGCSFRKAQTDVKEYFNERLDEFDAVVNVRAARRAGIMSPPSTDADLVAIDDDLDPDVVFAAPGRMEGFGEFEFEGLAVDVGDGADRLVPPRVRQWSNSLLDLSGNNSLLRMKMGSRGRPSTRFMEFAMPPDLLAKVDDALFESGRRLEISTPAAFPAKHKREGITDNEAFEQLRQMPSALMYPPYSEINALPDKVANSIAHRDSEADSPLAGQTNLQIETRLVSGAEADWATTLDRRLSKLASLANESMLANGTNSLFLALGALMWTEEAGYQGASKSVTWTAPLYLYPVVIEGGRGGSYSVRLDPSSSITPNYCLREKLRRPPYNLDLPELEYPEADESGIDLDGMLGSIRAKLTAANLTNFVVQSRCVLGVFEYSSFRLWRDLHEHWSDFCAASPVVNHLVYRPNEAYLPEQADESAALDPYLPIDADDSQQQAVQWALDGRSFRLEGPPGTGKTQTITNLIASCMAHGKTVLFVAEKQTALQQVKKRLYSVGLGDFSLELHAKGDSDARLRRTITEQVTRALAADVSLDDRAWENLLHQVRSAGERLDAYRDAIHEPNVAGLSYWRSREELVKLGEQPLIEVDDLFVAEFNDRWPRLRDSVAEVASALDLVDHPAEAPWRFVDGTVDSPDWQQIGMAVRSVGPAVDAYCALEGGAGELNRISDPAVFDVLQVGLGLHADGIHPTGDALTLNADALQAWNIRFAGLGDEVARLVERLAPLRGVVASGFFARDDHDRLAQALRSAQTASFIARGRRMADVQALIGSDALSKDRTQVYDAAAELLEVAGDVNGVRTAAAELGITLPGNWSPLDADAHDQFMAVGSRVAGYVGGLSLMQSAQPIARRIASGASAATAVTQLVDAWQRLGNLLTMSAKSFDRWLAGRSFSAAVSADVTLWERDGGNNDRFVELQRWIGLIEATRRLADLGLAEVADDIVAGARGIDGLLDAVQRGVLTLVIAERALAGNIDRFDTARHEQRIADYDRGLGELRKMMTERLAALARRPHGGGDGERSRAAAQELLRELKPIRGEKTPVRSLLARHGAELADIMPCFLMSPDSVAALLPVGSVNFDVVVFDEASQVRTASAVGALGRGRAAIVVGDSKQMPPTAAFSANAGRFVDDPDDLDEPAGPDDEPIEGAEEIDGESTVPMVVAVGQAARDVESILQEFEASRLPHMQLECHYRSQDELLIAFSNAEIYDTPMLTFPSRSGMESTALSFVRVDGQFIRKGRQSMVVDGGENVPLLRTNRVEAEAVVAEVLSRLRDPQRRARRQQGRRDGAESIIVVTFNKPQMVLIETMLRHMADPGDQKLVADALAEEKNDETGVQVADAQLKIRNLESVQGDEAETVIFSVAFSKLAPDESKNPSSNVPLNFGPVTGQGGFRRLNVAVTRAQREMVVFCSFDPADMAIKDTTSEGARLLQKFLQLAKAGPQHSGSVGIAVERSTHVAEVADAIKNLGYRTTTQLGLSRLRVDVAVGLIDGKGWDVAVMLDGPQWASRGSAFQRELLPQKVLTRLGWMSVLRVWLPSWLHDRDRTLAELKVAIDAAMAKAESPIEQLSPPVDDDLAPPTRPDVPSVAEVPTQANNGEPVAEVHPGDGIAAETPDPEHPGGSEQQVSAHVGPSEPATTDPIDDIAASPAVSSVDLPGGGPQRRDFFAYEPVIVDGAEGLRRFGDPAVDEEVRSIMARVLVTEAPVEVTRLTRLVGRCLGIQRVSGATATALRSLIPSELIVDDPVGTTVWVSPSQRADWSGFRPSHEAARSVDEIPFVELSEAVRYLRSTGITSDEELLRPLANLFGIRRIGAQVRAHLERIVELTANPDRPTDGPALPAAAFGDGD